jgi:hypothetical protein
LLVSPETGEILSPTPRKSAAVTTPHVASAPTTPRADPQGTFASASTPHARRPNMSTPSSAVAPSLSATFMSMPPPEIASSDSSVPLLVGAKRMPDFEYTLGGKPEFVGKSSRFQLEMGRLMKCFGSRRPSKTEFTSDDDMR